MTQAILETRGIVKDYGEFRALDGIDFSLPPGELRAIIGPNGAGKTTFFNVITHKFKASGGKVFFGGKDITNLPSHKIVKLGITRAFQIISLFPKLTVFENLMCALLTIKERNLRMFSSAKGYADIREEAFRILETVEMGAQANVLCGTLAHGDKKKLDLAIGLACAPKLLLLDEPTAGMSPEETESTTKLIRRICEQEHITILFTEHDMSVVFAIADNITVLHQGKVIAQGKPEDVREDRGVVEAYLGEEF